VIPGLLSDLRLGVERYHELDPRDDTYIVARRHVEASWPDPPATADAVAVLLRIWNGANRGVGPSPDRIADEIQKHQKQLTVFRNLNIHSITDSEAKLAGDLLNAFREPAGVLRNGTWNQSSVGAAKALHVVAPSSLPPWDEKVAIGVGCGNRSAEDYAAFLLLARDWIAAQIGGPRSCADEVALLDEKYGQAKSIVRRLDEYLFMRFTKNDGIW
jgi:hypothetical protein